jgi:nucleoside-diphosphate-sugar epimerase
MLNPQGKLFATGVSGVIARSVSKDCSPVSYRSFLYSGKLDASSDYLNGTLIHFAGIVGESLINTDPRAALRVNVEGVLDFARALEARGLRRFVFVSSSHAYGSSSIPISEDHELKPFSNYGELKVQAESALRLTFLKSTMDVRIVRPFSILGYGMPEFSLHGAVMRSQDRGETIRNSLDMRDFLTPEVMGRRILQLSLAASDLNSITVNACSGITRTVEEAAIQLVRDYGLTAGLLSFDFKTSKNAKIIGNPTFQNRLLAD